MLLLAAAAGLRGQVPDSKNVLSLSGGKLVYGEPAHPFFPGGINNNGFSVRADYLHTILPWMKIGLEGTLLFPGLPAHYTDEFMKIGSQNERLITAGVNATFFVPYSESGWRNRWRFQIGLAPVMVLHQGSRTISIDNSVSQAWTNQPEDPTIVLNDASPRLGWSVTPAVDYYLLPGAGLRVSLNSLFTTLKSDRAVENAVFHSLDVGLFYVL